MSLTEESKLIINSLCNTESYEIWEKILQEKLTCDNFEKSPDIFSERGTIMSIISEDSPERISEITEIVSCIRKRNLPFWTYQEIAFISWEALKKFRKTGKKEDLDALRKEFYLLAGIEDWYSLYNTIWFKENPPS